MFRVALFLFTISCLGARPARAAWWTPPAACEQAVNDAERNARIPTRLLDAISKVESGRRSIEGTLVAWPWTINAQGQGYFYNSKAEAVAAARDFQQRGIDSIDVGCLQINLHHHPNAFMSLEAAFDPVVNAQYGAHFLNDLFERFHGWSAATAAYHSLTPELGQDYTQRVMALWGHSDGSGISLTNGLASASASSTSFPAGSSMARPRPFAAASFAPMPRIIRSTTAQTAPDMGAASGRTLAAYRLNPVRLAWRR